MLGDLLLGAIKRSMTDDGWNLLCSKDHQIKKQEV